MGRHELRLFNSNLNDTYAVERGWNQNCFSDLLHAEGWRGHGHNTNKIRGQGLAQCSFSPPVQTTFAKQGVFCFVPTDRCRFTKRSYIVSVNRNTHSLLEWGPGQSDLTGPALKKGKVKGFLEVSRSRDSRRNLQRFPLPLFSDSVICQVIPLINFWAKKEVDCKVLIINI